MTIGAVKSSYDPPMIPTRPLVSGRFLTSQSTVSYASVASSIPVLFDAGPTATTADYELTERCVPEIFNSHLPLIRFNGIRPETKPNIPTSQRPPRSTFFIASCAFSFTTLVDLGLNVWRRRRGMRMSSPGHLLVPAAESFTRPKLPATTGVAVTQNCPLPALTAGR